MVLARVQARDVVLDLAGLETRLWRAEAAAESERRQVATRAGQRKKEAEALAAQLRGRGPELAAQADEIERCQILLGCIADEIRVCKDTSPMRVLGLVAQPSVVFTLTSILTSILVLEVRDLGVIPFLS